MLQTKPDKYTSPTLQSCMLPHAPISPLKVSTLKYKVFYDPVELSAFVAKAALPRRYKSSHPCVQFNTRMHFPINEFVLRPNFRAAA